MTYHSAVFGIKFPDRFLAILNIKFPDFFLAILNILSVCNDVIASLLLLGHESDSRMQIVERIDLPGAGVSVDLLRHHAKGYLLRYGRSN